MITVKKKMGPVGEFLFAVVFFAAGFGIVYLMGSDFILTCHRSQDQCIIEEDNLIKGKELITTLAMSDIRQAVVAESRDSKGKSSYQAMLEVNETRVPLSDVSTGSYSSCSKQVNKINQYLKSKDNDFSTCLSGTAPTIIGFIFGGVGAFLLLRTFWKMTRLMLGLVLVMAGMRPR